MCWAVFLFLVLLWPHNLPAQQNQSFVALGNVWSFQYASPPWNPMNLSITDDTTAFNGKKFFLLENISNTFPKMWIRITADGITCIDFYTGSEILLFDYNSNDLREFNFQPGPGEPVMVSAKRFMALPYTFFGIEDTVQKFGLGYFFDAGFYIYISEKLGIVFYQGLMFSTIDYNLSGVHVNGVTYGTILGNEEKKFPVDDYSIGQNYPNPFNPSTNISFAVEQTGNVTITLYDVTGKQVALLVNGMYEAGTHSLTVNAADYNLGSGIYFYKMQAGSFISVKKLVLSK